MVYDEMPRSDAAAKRRKGTLVRGADYVPDSESESDKDSVLLAEGGTSVSTAGVADYVPDSESDKEDCVPLRGGGMKVLARLSAYPNLIDLNVVPMGSDVTDEGRRDGYVRAGEGETGEAYNRNGHLLSGGESMHLHVSAAARIVKSTLASPVAISATAEAYAGMNSTEDLLKHESGDKGKEKLVLGNNDSAAAAFSVGVRAGARTRKFSRDDKGKGKMVVEEGLLPQGLGNADMDVEPVASEANQSIPGAADAPVEPLWRQAARERAIKLAPKFAFFKPDEDVQSEEDDAEELEPPAGPQDWPGPFSTAMRIMDDRDAKLRARELNPSKLDSIADKVISWTPSKDKKRTPVRPGPSLTSLCLRTLANNAEGIESLGGISEELKNKLLMELCHSRKMNTHLLTELLCDNPVTLQLSECSWLSEDDFGNIFGKCMTESLEVYCFPLMQFMFNDHVVYCTTAFAKHMNLFSGYKNWRTSQI
jgi:DNA repair protein RAD7